MKLIVFSLHALAQLLERGATQEEVERAIREGIPGPARAGRWMYRMNFGYNRCWRGGFYAVKQVAPVVAEERDELVVVTVYTFYF